MRGVTVCNARSLQRVGYRARWMIFVIVSVAATCMFRKATNSQYMRVPPCTRRWRCRAARWCGELCPCSAQRALGRKLQPYSRLIRCIMRPNIDDLRHGVSIAAYRRVSKVQPCGEFGEVAIVTRWVTIECVRGAFDVAVGLFEVCKVTPANRLTNPVQQGRTTVIM